MSKEKYNEYVAKISKKLRKKTDALSDAMTELMLELTKEKDLTKPERIDIATKIIVSPIVVITRNMTPGFQDRMGIYRMMQETDYKIQYDEPEYLAG